MAQADKAAYYRALKENGYKFEKHFREFTTEQLKERWEAVAEANGVDPNIALPAPKDAPPARDDEVKALAEQLAGLTGVVQSLAQMLQEQPLQPSKAGAAAKREPEQEKGMAEPKRPQPQLDPTEHAGVTQNLPDDQVLHVDEFGNEWLQLEVNKPAFPKPRGRRVLKYEDPGVRTETIKVGEYEETFEVAGDPRNARPSEIKITLPSYQTGIYRAPDMPFKIHCYGGVRGFDLFEVQEYFGGSDLVPDTVKRMYVSTDLCYDIQSTIRTIENLYREHVLGKAALTK